MYRYIPLYLLAVSVLSCCGGPMTPSTAPTAPGLALTLAPEPPEPCTTETLACFHFTGTLYVAGSPSPISGWSEDLPTPGYANRWHYLLSPPAAQALAVYTKPITGWNGGAAVIWPDGRGGMFMETLTAPGGSAYWRLDMHPTSDTVAHSFAKLAGAAEYLTQTFSVRALNTAGGAEILITQLCDGTPARTCP